MSPVEQQGSSENLTQFCSYERRQLLGNIVPIVWALRSNPHFDELVRFEGIVDGGNDSIREAMFADLNERIEVMSERSQVALLLARKTHGLSAWNVEQRRSKEWNRAV